MRPRRGEPERLGALVPRVLSELGLEASARAFRLAERWSEAVGEEVARHSRPEALRGEVLEVRVGSSTWCQALVLRKPELLAALRATCGEDAPRDLRLRVGELR